MWCQKTHGERYLDELVLLGTPHFMGVEAHVPEHGGYSIDYDTGTGRARLVHVAVDSGPPD